VACLDDLERRTISVMGIDDPELALRWQPARPVLTVVGCHAGGEIGNVVVAGVDPPPGDTAFEQMEAIRADDSIRKLLLHEPRGSVAVHSNIVLASKREDCAFGYVIMEPTEYPAMSGSNTICVATVLLETGIVEMREPTTTFRLEAPGGPIDITAGCRGGKAAWVELENVPSFVDRLDAPLEVEGLGTVVVDVAFGGMWYAIAAADALGFALEPSEARDLSAVGTRIHAAAREQLHPVHPENPDIAGVSIVELAEPWRGVGAVTKNAVVVAPGRLDRSATGTGLSARIATLHARGLMRVGDSMTHASVIGSTFDGRIVREVDVARRPAVVPAIRGSAWITGVTRVLLDPTDPFPEGYVLSDTWPGGDVQG
jgi:proline racemase